MQEKIFNTILKIVNNRKNHFPKELFHLKVFSSMNASHAYERGLLKLDYQLTIKGKFLKKF